MVLQVEAEGGMYSGEFVKGKPEGAGVMETAAGAGYAGCAPSEF